jgi:hypothetical protein
VIELRDNSDQKREICLILFIISIVVLVIILLTLIPVVTSVNKQKDKVLSLFCEIDDPSIRILNVRCEKFITKLYSENNDDEIESNDEYDNF